MSYGPLPKQQPSPAYSGSPPPGYTPQRAAPVYGTSPPGYLLGLVLAIVVIIIAVVVIIWLVRQGLSLAGEVLANGEKRGFPLSFILAIVFAILILIITLVLVFWVVRLAGRATNAVAGNSFRY